MMKHDVNKYINKNAMSVAISKKRKYGIVQIELTKWNSE